MSQTVREVLLWLFVMNLGVAFGAGLYESRVVIPEWAGISPRTWPNTGLLFWVYVTTVPLTLLTIAGAVTAWRSYEPMRSWYVAAVAIIIVERLATFSYFIPVMVRLMGAGDLPEAEVRSALSQWQMLNYVRHFLTLAGWVAALKALSLANYTRLAVQTDRSDL